jgi:3-dehydroquinate synthase
MRRVTVAVEPPYDVVVGPGVLAELEALVGERRRIAIVTQPALADGYADLLPRALARPAPLGTESSSGEPGLWLVLIGDGEEAKSIDTVQHLCRAFADGGLLRSDVVVALGGGVVGDTAGFAAAIYHRGVDVVQVPTTLLAQVDAAIGGKTAVNLPEGKNLVGAFHQPIGVVADTAVLAGLPPAEYRSGLGEVAKYALMPEGGAVDALLREQADAVRARDPEVLAELVATCAELKAQVVAADPYERRGGRAVLNYGHTLAHALETTGGYALAHGEAVAVGLVFAVTLARVLERVAADDVDRTRELLVALGLPTHVSGLPVDAQQVLAAMRRDKKARGGLTFVLPGPDGLETVDDPPARALTVALDAVGVA